MILKKLLARRGRRLASEPAKAADAADQELPPATDAVCTISISVPRQGLGGKLAAGFRWERLAPSAPSAAPSRGCSSVADLPDAAIDAIWLHLSNEDRASARLASRALRRATAPAVRRVSLRPADLASFQPARFPGLSELALQLSGSCPAADAELEQYQLLAFVRSVAASGGFPHLQAIHVAGRVRGPTLAALARLAAAAPSVQRLRLPGLRVGPSGGGRRSSDGGGDRGGDAGRGRGDERHLCGLLDALPGLVELDLGSAAAAAGGGGGAPLPPAALRRVAGLSRLEVLSADASGPRDCGAAAAALARLPMLRRLALLVGAPGCGGGEHLAAALGGLTRLEHLELESCDLGDEFAAALDLARLQRLQVLALGMCPALPPSVAAKIAHLPRVHRLTLPFALDADALRALATLPALSELYTWSVVSLGGAAGPPPAPAGAPPAPPAGLSILSRPPVALAAVTKLVASCVRADDEDPFAAPPAAAGPPGPRHELAAVFPALRSLYVKRGGDGELRLAAGCAARLETLVLHSAARATDDGLPLLAACRGLARLQVEDAPRLSDDGFSRLFAAPAPSLAHLALHGLPHLTDGALLAATASCRRLASVSLACAPGLTDKTLSRLGRMERLATATLVRLGPGVTAEGVVALAAAPAMASVHVAGCRGVRARGCREHRPSVRVRIDDVSV